MPSETVQARVEAFIRATDLIPTGGAVTALVSGGPDSTCLWHVLATLGIRYLRLDQVDLYMAAVVCALPVMLPLVYFMMKRLSK